MTRNVTVIGGGTGSYNLLTGLKPYRDLHLQSIVTVMDSGGDSGRLRDEFGVLPPGDARRCWVALSEETQLMRELFSFRFNEPPLEGRSFGNLFFLALTKILGSEKEAFEAINRLLKIRGRVIAVTLDHTHLHCRLGDGSIVSGEANIDVPKHDASVPIDSVFLDPPVQANPDAIRAILESDFVVLAPGNLYTSTIPNLLVSGVPEALQATRGRLVYVLNLMTVFGETKGFTASAHIGEILRYGGRVPDAVLLHRGPIPSDVAERYRKQEADPVGLDSDALKELGVKTVRYRDLMSAVSFVRHDPVRTGEALHQLFDELHPADDD